MPQPHILKIAEIFPSIQGEGLRQGEPTIFVRLSGCNLRCPFCDTKYAWEEGRGMAVERVKDRIKALRKRFPAEWVCLTGGEPMLQDLEILVRGLKADGLKIQIETNGTIFQELAADWVTISPKPGKFAVHPRFRRLAKEVKLVVTRDLSFATVRQIRERFPATTPLLLQPESNAPWSAAKGLRLLARCQRNGLENVRFSIQLHKVFGLR